MKELISLLGLAKARVDNGFSQVGKSLDPADPVARVLMLLASRAIAIANAILLLGMNDHANESLPLLRSLFEVAAHMRWISEKDHDRRAREFLEEHRSPDWERLWPNARLLERMEIFGFDPIIREKAALSCYDHIHGNVAGLPWGHVFEGSGYKGFSSENLLTTAVILMGHVVKALDLRWPGKFSGAEQMWERVRG